MSSVKDLLNSDSSSISDDDREGSEDREESSTKDKGSSSSISTFVIGEDSFEEGFTIQDLLDAGYQLEDSWLGYDEEGLSETSISKNADIICSLAFEKDDMIIYVNEIVNLKKARSLLKCEIADFTVLSDDEAELIPGLTLNETSKKKAISAVRSVYNIRDNKDDEELQTVSFTVCNTKDKVAGLNLIYDDADVVTRFGYRVMYRAIEDCVSLEDIYEGTTSSSSKSHSSSSSRSHSSSSRTQSSSSTESGAPIVTAKSAVEIDGVVYTPDDTVQKLLDNGWKWTQESIDEGDLDKKFSAHTRVYTIGMYMIKDGLKISVSGVNYSEHDATLAECNITYISFSKDYDADRVDLISINGVHFGDSPSTVKSIMASTDFTEVYDKNNMLKYEDSSGTTVSFSFSSYNDALLSASVDFEIDYDLL